MAFQASSLLEKFGWEAGKGLGRSESGDVEAIKVARKSNTKGLGERGSHWGNDWWDRMYTKALDNVDKKEDKKEEQKESLLFGSFTKAKSLSTLADRSEESDYESEDSSVDDPEEKKRKQKSTHHMQDSDVFEACNGMILRKFVPLGKLERIAQQDAEWKKKFAPKGSITTDDLDSPKKSKKRKRETTVEIVEESPKKKQKTKKPSKKEKSLHEEEQSTKKQKKKRKSTDKKKKEKRRKSKREKKNVE